MMITEHSRSRRRRRRFTRLALALAMLAIAAPSAALAQGSDPSEAQYAPTSQQIAAGGGGEDPGEGGQIGGLPLTGLDLGVLVIAATVLVGTGVALRRLSDPARRSSAS
jgi:hypothetical protein